MLEWIKRRTKYARAAGIWADVVGIDPRDKGQTALRADEIVRVLQYSPQDAWLCAMADWIVEMPPCSLKLNLVHGFSVFAQSPRAQVAFSEVPFIYGLKLFEGLADYFEGSGKSIEENLHLIDDDVSGEVNNSTRNPTPAQALPKTYTAREEPVIPKIDWNRAEVIIRKCINVHLDSWSDQVSPLTRKIKKCLDDVGFSSSDEKVAHRLNLALLTTNLLHIETRYRERRGYIESQLRELISACINSAKFAGLPDRVAISDIVVDENEIKILIQKIAGLTPDNFSVARVRLLPLIDALIKIRREPYRKWHTQMIKGVKSGPLPILWGIVAPRGIDLVAPLQLSRLDQLRAKVRIPAD